MTQRYLAHRAGDPWIVRAAALFFRWRGLATILWMGLASAGTSVLLAARFSPHLAAIDRESAALELRHDVTERKVDSLWVQERILVRSACLDRTKTEQQMIVMACPDGLYKGTKP